MKKFYRLPSKFFCLLCLGFAPLMLAAQAPTISYLAETAGLAVPIDVINAGDGSNRLFIVEQAGTVQVRNGNTVTLFANFGTGGENIISYQPGSERGLLSMAFHPDYNGTTNRYFFIYFTDLNGDIAVRRYQTADGNSNSFDPDSETPIIIIPHREAGNHNGGKLNFGADGYLYFATGDGGDGNDPNNNAQNGQVLLGKMLRIDIDNTSTTYGNYAVPANNPYVNDPNVDDRIWAIGLRNPFRWSFDRLTGDMWIGDVGQGAFEEVNFRPAASTGHVNYGWRCFEGYVSTPGVADCTPADYVPPVFDYPNPGGSAVTGGYVYRGTEFPNFAGYYISTDVYSGDIFILAPNNNGGFDSTIQVNMPVNYVVGFGEGEDGTLYAVSQATNTLYKVIATGGVVLPVSLTSFSGALNTGFNDLRWNTAAEQNVRAYNVEFSRDGAPFTRAGVVSANRSSTGSNYSFKHYINNSADILYRLAIEDDNGQVSYSSIVRLSGLQKNSIRIYPTIITTGTLNLEVYGKKVNAFRVLNSTGRVVYRKEIKAVANNLSLYLPPLSKGIYIVEVQGDGTRYTEKIVIR